MEEKASRPFDGHFGPYGGRYVPETLMRALDELEDAYGQAEADPSFQAELDSWLGDYVGRPSPLYLAANMGKKYGNIKLYLKREDLNHTGSHKINNCLGQGLARAQDGQAPRHRRDGRRPARRRDGDDGGAVRFRVRSLHGRGGHAPAGPQRLSDETPRRQGDDASPPDRGRSRTPPTRQCATGWLRCATRITCSARSSGRIRFR